MNTQKKYKIFALLFTVLGSLMCIYSLINIFHTSFIAPVLSLFILTIGVLLFVKLKKITTQMQKALEEQQTTQNKKPETLIERNNKIVSQWFKTSEARDRLKLLKIAADAQEKANPVS